MTVFGILGVLGLICLSVGLLLALHEERKMSRIREEVWEGERKELLNRIQVPQAAPFMTDEITETPVQHVGFDNDEDFWAAQGEDQALLRADE